MADKTGSAAATPAEDEIKTGLSQPEKDKLFKKLDYKMHPLAASQPPINPGDFVNLKNSIRLIGVQDNIELAKDDTGSWGVIDGNTRLRAVSELIEEGIDKAENGTELVGPDLFMKHTTNDQKEIWDIINARSSRRNLKPIQRAAVAVRMDTQRKQILRKMGEKVPTESYDEMWERLHKVSGCNKDHVQACLRASRESSNRDLLDRMADGVLTALDARKYMDGRKAGKSDEETDKEEAKKKNAGDGKKVPDIFFDSKEKEVPEYLVTTFATAKSIQDFRKKLDALRKEFASIAAGPGGESLLMPVFDDARKNVKDHLKEVEPDEICPKAKKTKGCEKTCPVCKGYSFLTLQRKAEIEAEKTGVAVDDTTGAGSADEVTAKEESKKE